VILAYSEGLPDGQRFINVARAVTRQKPVVALKSGVTSAGSRAVSSHTGSLAGSEQAYKAAFEQAGVLRAESLEELFDVAQAFAYQPLAAGDRVAIVTNAGGPGILATDALSAPGCAWRAWRPDTVNTLTGFLPDAASSHNPVDVLGDAAPIVTPSRPRSAGDPQVDAVLVILTPQAMTEIEATARADQPAGAAGQTAKPVLACFMGAKRVQAGIDVLRATGAELRLSRAGGAGTAR
jgi:acetyltransferase